MATASAETSLVRPAGRPGSPAPRLLPRRAKVYSLTAAGRKQLAEQRESWARFSGALDDDMQEEMRAHLAQAAERLVARGMSPADARIAARREFGNVAVLQEEAREVRGARWVDEFTSDLRFAFRYFARNRLTTTTVLAVLALGIGANTALFSLMQGEVMRPAPVDPATTLRVE